jgi:copper(I)-binding protein
MTRATGVLARARERSPFMHAPMFVPLRLFVPLRRTAVLAAAAVLGVVAVTGCSSSSDTATSSSTSATSGSAVATGRPSAGATLILADGWVKAAPSGMTALFGTLENTGSAPVTVTGGSSSAAGMVELHEVVMVAGELKMQPKAGGFVIEAGGTHQLAPGHDHIMLMGLERAVKPGDQVTVDLMLDNGSTVSVSGLAKDFAAGNERYQPTPGRSSGMASGTASNSSISGM